ncbi:MAG: hypothetical protein JXB46_04995 [Candidatus Eisenbacteria bacterium]|nr:hypothetical protein [Candidatus Eisenbacteria bacterium]
MKRLIGIFVCVLLTASMAYATKPNDSKFMTDEFKPIPDVSKLYFEGFEAGVPPAGWTAIVTDPGYTWTSDTYAPYEGLYYATCYYDPALLYQDEWICFEYVLEPGDECLSFWTNASVYWAIDPYQNYNLYVTINGVEKWNYRDDTVEPVNWLWQQYGVPLGEYSVGETIEICFGYVGIDGAQGSFDAIEIGACPPPPPEPCCPFDFDCYVFDFNTGPGGAVFFDCGLGTNPWAWGTDPLIPQTACDGVPVTNIMGTSLGSTYPVSTGGGFYIGPVAITPVCDCLELCHYYDTESSYDGGNVKVSTDGGSTWTLVYPFGGYDGTLTSTYYPAECVWLEEVFYGASVNFVRDCFDLSDFEGLEILIGFFFGSESYATSDIGWYIKWAKIGSNNVTPVEDSSWGAIKALYR